MLAYLALSERRVARARLAGLIFGDAEDPRGALRWTLAQLRRALGAGDAGGDPLELGLPAGAAIDVLALASGEPDPGLVRGELLEGIVPGAGPDFDAWLLVEPRRFAGVCEAVLSDAALAGLGPAPRSTAPPRLADVELHPSTTGARAAGPLPVARVTGGARNHAEACEALFRRELGRDARSGRAPGCRRRAGPPRATARPPLGSSTRGAGRSTPGPSTPGSRACASPVPRRAGSATRRCSRGRWRPSAPRSCTRSAAATRRERRCCTRRSRSRRRAATARSSARSAASSASSPARRRAGSPPAAGWRGPAAWRRMTASAPPYSACAARRCPTARTTRRRSGCSASRSRRRDAVERSARRRSRWPSSGAR